MGAGALADILDTTGLFYYMTMKDFERKNRKTERSASNPRRVFPMEKQLFMMQNRKKLQRDFSISSLQKDCKKQKVRLESYEELFQFLSRLNIGECFTPNIELNKGVPCRIYEGNYAWISQNSQGHYRYFSRRRDKVTISLDFLDFVEIYFGLNTYGAIDKIVKLFGIQFMEEEWKKERKQKYFKNTQILYDKFSSYPHLFNLLSEHCTVLEAMNVLGNVHIYKKEYSYKNENLFFASTSHISNFLQTSNTSKTNQLINLFATLGFIEKVSTAHIHPLFLKKSADIVDKRNLGNRINYYIIHNFEAVVEIAEERAKILLENGIRYSKVSKSTVENLFGVDFAELVYPQTIQKNKKKETCKRENIELKLEENFISLLNEQGYLTKSMVAFMPVYDLTLEKKQSYLKKIWSRLIYQYGCNYNKPTIQMKYTYELPNFEYVAYKRCELKEIERRR